MSQTTVDTRNNTYATQLVYSNQSLGISIFKHSTVHNHSMNINNIYID